MKNHRDSRQSRVKDTRKAPNGNFGITGISPRLLDVKQAAFYLSISDWTVRDLIASGQLSPVKIPRPYKEGEYLDRKLLDVQDLDLYIDGLKSYGIQAQTGRKKTQ